MPSVRAYNNRFCARCNAVELHRDLACLACEREQGVAPPSASRPQEKAPRRRQRGPLGRPAATDLTAAEARVAHLIATGLTQSEIAAQLQCHPSSVSNTVRRAISRLGIETTYELVRHMRQRGTGA